MIGGKEPMIAFDPGIYVGRLTGVIVFDGASTTATSNTLKRNLRLETSPVVVALALMRVDLWAQV